MSFPASFAQFHVNLLVKPLGEREIRETCDGYFGLISSCRYVTLQILLTSVHC